MKIQNTNYLETCGGKGAAASILGLPFDGTCSFKPGCRFGPRAIRDASWGLETYCPELDAELSGEKVEDLGDLELPLNGAASAVELIYEAARAALAEGKRLLCLGGEHLVSYPLIKAYAQKFQDLTILHFDAHADLRENYLGERLSHASAMSLCLDFVAPQRLKQFGIRSGTRQEFSLIREYATLHSPNAEGIAKALSDSSGPLYISVDIDVFDPGFAPGTGTPEPGGICYADFSSCLKAIADSGRHVAGCDVVEVCPPCDPSGITAMLAAKVTRGMLILMGGA